VTLNTLIVLAIGIGVALILRQLSKINERLGQVQRTVLDQTAAAASVHDVTHPVFSLLQLQHVRQGFESAFKEKDRLEQELHRSEDWVGMKQPVVPSPKLQERMKAVCDAVAKAESAWREYVWMVEANVAVANGGESRADALHRFGELTKSAPAASDRARDLMTSWNARLRGESQEEVQIQLPDNKVDLLRPGRAN
jgi:hypothetical protein